MGQAPAGQLGQAGGGNFGAAPNDDAFRHFRDNSGGLSHGNHNQQFQPYSHQIQPLNPILDGMQNAVLHGVQGGFRKTKEVCASLPLYTDMTRPNGNPMARASPMDRELPPHGFAQHRQDTDYGGPRMDNGFGPSRVDGGVGPSSRVDSGVGPTRMDSGVGPSSPYRNPRAMDHELGPTRPNSNFNMHDNDGYSNCSRASPCAPAPAPVPTKAEASTMMSTAFLRRSEVSAREANPTEEKRDEFVHYRINTNMEHIGEPASGMHHQNQPQHQHQESMYNGMVTSDEPIVGVPMSQQQSHLNQQHQMLPQLRSPPQDSSSSCAHGASAAKVNVQDELRLRESWKVGSVIEVYSTSSSKWYIAQVVKIGAANAPGTLTAQFIGDNGQIMQKTMPKSDVQLAHFGRNTRQMPPGFQKVASESRPGEFSYQDTSTMTKYQTKEFAWQSYYEKVLKCEQAQQLLAQQHGGPAAKQASKPPHTMSLAQQPPMPAPPRTTESLSPELYAGANGPDPILARTWKDSKMPQESPQFMQPVTTSALGGNGAQSAGEAYSSYAANTGPPSKLESRPSFVQQCKPITVGEMSSLPKPASSGLQPSAPFPGYGQSFAVGSNAGYESYLASQGLL